MQVTDHSAQLKRVADEILDLLRGSYGYGFMRSINFVMFFLEMFTLILAIYSLFEGHIGPAFVEFLIAVIILILHAVAMGFEKWMHHVHDERAKRLDNELRQKAKIIATDAAANNLAL